MIQDPTVGLRNAMAAVDLYPGDIVWDGAFHRFPGAGKKKSNKSGWYKAFADRKGGVFGDYSTGVRVNWQADRSSEPTKSMREEWAEEDARRKKERAEASKKANRGSEGRLEERGQVTGEGRGAPLHQGEGDQGLRAAPNLPSRRSWTDGPCQLASCSYRCWSTRSR